jgi:hypothetical protein
MMEIQELLERLKGLDDELLAKDNSVSETQLMLSCRQRHVRFLEDLLAISQEGEIKEIIHNEQTGAVIKETVHKLGSSGSVVLDIVRRSYSGQRQEYEVELDNAKLAIELQQQQIQVQAEEVQQLVKAYETATQEYHQLTEKITGLKIEVQDAKAHVETTAVEKNLLVRARKRYGAAVETYKHKIDLYSEVLALAEQRATASGTALKNVLAEVWNLRKQGEVLQLRHMTKLQKFRTVVGTANSLTSELTDAKATVTDAKSKISDARSRELSFIERQRQEQAKQTALLTQIAEQKARNAAAVLLVKYAQALQDDTVAALDEDERQRALLSNVKEAQEAKAADETVGEEAQDEPEEESVQVGRKRKASTSPVEPSNRVKKARKRQR